MKDESQRLKETYAEMFDGELENLAADMDSLTDLAKPLLLAEMSRRGLDLTSNEASAPDLILDPDAQNVEDQDVDDVDALTAIPDYDSRCPKCQSPDVVFLAREASHGEEPDSDAGFHWVCDVCQHEWVDDGLAAQ